MADTGGMSVMDEPTRVLHEAEVELVTTPPRARLEELLGRDFAKLLLLALAPAQGRRSSSP
jgi:hypothetical protein